MVSVKIGYHKKEILWYHREVYILPEWVTDGGWYNEDPVRDSLNIPEKVLSVSSIDYGEEKPEDIKLKKVIRHFPHKIYCKNRD